MRYQSSIQDPELARLKRARARLASKAPGYASIAFGLALIERNDIATMATDGQAIYWNRRFVQSLSDKELVGLLMHEGLHVMLGHHLRRPKRSSNKLWNEACDYAINSVIVKTDINLPSDALLCSDFDLLSAERILRVLEGEQPNDRSPGGGQGDDQGDDQGEQEQDQPSAPGQPKDFSHAGEVWDATNADGDPASQEEMADLEEDLKRSIILAAEVEKATGSGSISIDAGILDATKSSKVEWQEHLADFLARNLPDEPTLESPNRRHLWNGDYFPSMRGVGAGLFVLAIDTSASVSLEERQQFAGEVDAIRSIANPEQTLVVYCDSQIQPNAEGELYDEFGRDEEIIVRDVRGGGTRFDPPFRLVEEEGLEPDVLIYLTDGGAVAPPMPPDYPVFWATTCREPAWAGEQFGEVVEVF